MNLYPPLDEGDNGNGDVSRAQIKSPEKQQKQPKKSRAKKVIPVAEVPGMWLNVIYNF